MRARHWRSRSRRLLGVAFGALLMLSSGCTPSPPGQSHVAKTHHVDAHRHRSVSPPHAGRRQHRHRKPPPKPSRPPSPGAPQADMPNPKLTPGVVLTTNTARVCTPGYSAAVRDVPTSESDAVYARYHVVHVPYAHEVDHLISLELGGSNAIGNLWPEPYAVRWGARTKDVLENRLHDLVCSHALSLPTAQHLEATDWVAAYRRFVGKPTIAQSPHRRPKTTRSSGGSCEPGYSSCLPVASDLDC